MNNISEFSVVVYKNMVVFEMSNVENLEPDAHDAIIERLCEVIQNEFADDIRKVFDKVLSEEHAHGSQNRGAF